MTPMTPMDRPAESAQSAPSVDGPVRKRSRLPQDIPDDAVVNYAAARAFLLGEWFGAGLLVASFALLYLLAFGAHASPTATYLVCGALLLVGAIVYFRSRIYYARIDLDISPRSHLLAAVVAGSAGIFWLLFVFLVVLAWFGIPLQ